MNAAALADTQRFSQPQTMLLLNPDRGDRYLETVYNTDWLSLTPVGDRIVQN